MEKIPYCGSIDHPANVCKGDTGVPDLLKPTGSLAGEAPKAVKDYSDAVAIELSVNGDGSNATTKCEAAGPCVNMAEKIGEN